MRSPAQIGKVSLRIKGNLLVAGNGFDNLRLVMLPLILEKIDCLGAIPDLALDFQLAGADFRHAFLDCRQIFGRKRTLVGKIVIEAVLNHGTNGDLRIRKQFFHGMRQQMRAGMTDDFQPFWILFGDDTQVAVGFYWAGYVYQLAVHFACQRSASQSRTYRCRNIAYRHRLIVSAFRTIRQSNDSHHLPLL